MSGYNNGYLDASIRARASEADANTSIQSWMDHSARLQAQLDALKVQLAQRTATSGANFELAKELGQALGTVAPNHPMASREGRNQRLHELIRQKVDTLGYRVVDIETMVLAPK